jgi:hypothetical protein
MRGVRYSMNGHSALFEDRQMYTITALFTAKGRGAMNVTAETLELAHEKADKLKSQGYLIEIRDENGELVLTRLH